MKQRGFVHLLALLLIVIIAVVIFLAVKGIIKLPFNVPGIGQGSKVEVKTTYQNPFNKETQYVNPFETYKNPFTIAK